jgi:DNA-binding PadR family transcriptional regulator
VGAREAPVPTRLQHIILDELSLGRLSPSEIARRIDRKEESIVRALKAMMRNNWVGADWRVQEGLLLPHAKRGCGEAP